MLAKTVEINWHDGQAIYSVDFSPDGSRYATAGADNSVRVRPFFKVKKLKKSKFCSLFRFGAFINDLIMPPQIFQLPPPTIQLM